MTRRITFTVLLALLVLVLVASSAFTAREPQPRMQYNPVVRAIVDYAFIRGDESNVPDNPNRGIGRASLGTSTVSASPGQEIGNSFYDFQHNSTMGRMIATGTHNDAGTNVTLVHFAWMELPGPVLEARSPAYSFYDASSASLGSEIKMVFDPAYSGYVNLDAMPDNRAIISAHFRALPGDNFYAPRVWYDGGPGDGGFDFITFPDTALWMYENPFNFTDPNGPATVVWPRMGFQVRPDGAQITHVIAQTYGNGFGPGMSYYFRKISGAGTDPNSGSLSSCPSLSVTGWECPWVFDTIWSTGYLVVPSTQSGKLALVWTANRPAEGDPCDTCSQNATLGVLTDRFDNDLYYQISDDYGGTWNNRVNVTKYTEDSLEWRPGNDISAVFTGTAPNEELHIVWQATDWDRSGGLGFGARLFHWSEDNSALGPRTITQQINDPIQCNAGAFNFNLAKPQLSYCNGNLYCLFVDLWDGHNGDPENPDCSERGVSGDFSGAVNGELMLSISDNNGVSWDLPHNLTRSFTPGCDDGSVVGQCDGDHWPSMTRYGKAVIADDLWDLADTIIPRSTYTLAVGQEWLDVQYVNDKDAGFVLNDNSRWEENPIKWFRLACVGPDHIPVFAGSYLQIEWPAYTKPGIQKDTVFTVENVGNADMVMSSVTTVELTGSNWLDVADFGTAIPQGEYNKDPGTFNLNVGGVIDQAAVDAAGGSVYVHGLVIFDHNAPTDADTVLITLIVTDTVMVPDYDTITTGVLSLQVATNGQHGSRGDFRAGTGMDYFYDPLECDTIDSLPGVTEYYLYDGSFMAFRIDSITIPTEPDTQGYYGIFNQGPRNASSIYQTSAHTDPVTDGVFQTWTTGAMTNADTTIGFEVRYYAPQTTATWDNLNGPVWHADQQFITKATKVWAVDLDTSETLFGLTLGEALDWDVPSDSGSDNLGEVDASRFLLYQIGGEYNQPDTNLDPPAEVECQDNDHRYAGLAYGYKKLFNCCDTVGGRRSRVWELDTLNDGTFRGPYGGYIESNNHLVYSSNWTPGNLLAAIDGNGEAFTPWAHAHPDSAKTDLHTTMAYVHQFDLQGGDTIVFYTVLATVLNEPNADRIKELADLGRNFVEYYGCCVGLRGDMNGDGADGNILDLTFTVDWIFRGGVLPACDGEGDPNADGSTANILDLTFLVDGIFRGGPDPYSCGEEPCTTPGCHD